MMSIIDHGRAALIAKHGWPREEEFNCLSRAYLDLAKRLETAEGDGARAALEEVTDRTKPPEGYAVWDFYEGEGVPEVPGHEAWLWGVAHPDEDEEDPEPETRAQAMAGAQAHADRQRAIGREGGRDEVADALGMGGKPWPCIMAEIEQLRLDSANGSAIAERNVALQAQLKTAKEAGAREESLRIDDLFDEAIRYASDTGDTERVEALHEGVALLALPRTIAATEEPRCDVHDLLLADELCTCTPKEPAPVSQLPVRPHIGSVDWHEVWSGQVVPPSQVVVPDGNFHARPFIMITKDGDASFTNNTWCHGLHRAAAYSATGDLLAYRTGQGDYPHAPDDGWFVLATSEG